MGGGWYEPLLDLLPSPLLLIAPETGRVLFANRAAHDAAGGEFPMDAEASEHQSVAAGERIVNLRIEWKTPSGTRSLVASGDTIVRRAASRLGARPRRAGDAPGPRARSPAAGQPR